MEVQDRKYTIVSVVFEPDDLSRLDTIAKQIAQLLGSKRVNRSDALRRMIAEFDVDDWAQRHTPQRGAA